MEEYYYMFENAFLWGVVILATGLVAYLGYRQYRTVRVRRVHRRHRSRRRQRRMEASIQEAQTSPGQRS